MTAAELRMTLEQRGITLYLDHQELRYRARKGAMTEALRAAIQMRKAEFLAMLSEQPEKLDGDDHSLCSAARIRGEPCPKCGDTESWRTDRGYTCASCFVESLIPTDKSE